MGTVQSKTAQALFGRVRLAILTLLFIPQIERKLVFHRLIKHDSENLLFFTGLFVLIGGLEKARVFEALALMMTDATAGNPSGLVFALHWGPGLLSGVLDNVPLALAMSYVLHDISLVPGMPALGLMVWSLALGVNFGGNLTPIGASANVVAYSYLERNHGPVGWNRWLQVALVPTLVTMVLASALIMVKSQLGWH